MSDYPSPRPVGILRSGLEEEKDADDNHTDSKSCRHIVLLFSEKNHEDFLQENCCCYAELVRRGCGLEPKTKGARGGRLVEDSRPWTHEGL